MQYIQLKAGDIRQDGDEVSHNSGAQKYLGQDSRDERKQVWRPVNMLDSTILASDLISSSFRRPITAD